MAEAAIPVDLFNPGQVFACIGFAEAADVLLGDAEGVFDWSDRDRVVFRLRAQGDVSPVQRVLQFLDEAQVQAFVPQGSPALSAWKDGWGPAPSQRDRRAGYSMPDGKACDVLCCELADGSSTLLVDHWGDATGREPLKLWAGAGGYPGSSRLRDAHELGRGRYAGEAESDPFHWRARAHKKSSVRLDWRRDYIPIDLGFSLNEHGALFLSECFPITEVLGAFGLGNARPRRIGPMAYRYFVYGNDSPHDPWLPLPILRAMLGTNALPGLHRAFRAELGQPNDYDRIFTTVTEENPR